jgi:hypothetical protein
MIGISVDQCAQFSFTNFKSTAAKGMKMQQ